MVPNPNVDALENVTLFKLMVPVQLKVTELIGRLVPTLFVTSQSIISLLLPPRDVSAPTVRLDVGEAEAGVQLYILAGRLPGRVGARLAVAKLAAVMECTTVDEAVDSGRENTREQVVFSPGCRVCLMQLVPGLVVSLITPPPVFAIIRAVVTLDVIDGVTRSILPVLVSV
jgi:hypothetical protein